MRLDALEVSGEVWAPRHRPTRIGEDRTEVSTEDNWRRRLIVPVADGPAARSAANVTDASQLRDVAEREWLCEECVAPCQVLCASGQILGGGG